MSSKLKGYLQPKILKAIQSFGSADYSGPDNGTGAQSQFADELSTAIAEAVQQYINSDVLTAPQKPTVAASGPVNHVHTLVPDKLNAP